MRSPHHSVRSSLLAAAVSTAAALALAFGLLLAPQAVEAQPSKVKSTKTEAKFVSYEPNTKTLTVKVLKAGPKPKNRKLTMKAGKRAKFKIKPEGSILARTSITADGQRASIEDIPENKTLNIYWIPDERDPDVRFARKIDMVYTDAELEERDRRRLEDARARGEVSD